MRSRKVLVTGGLGFIGSELARSLREQGLAPRVLDNLNPQIHGAIPAIDRAALEASGVEVLRGDVTSARDLEAALEGVEAVAHLAAETGTGQSMYEIARYEQVNGLGTAVLLDLLANRKTSVKKVVLASSRSVYGEGEHRCAAHGTVHPEPRAPAALRAGDWTIRCPRCGSTVEPIPTSESAPARPASIYAATKLAQEHLVRIACSAMGIPFTTLRFQNVYGPGQSLDNPYSGLLSIFSTRIRRGLDLPIFEDGTQSRDFVHVRDAVGAVALALAPGCGDGATLNVGSGVPRSVADVAHQLNAALGGRSAVEVTGRYRVGDVRHCWADLRAIRAAMAWEPRVSLAEGLADFGRWVLTRPLPEDRLERANQELAARGLMP